jgi:hypothetical protein
VSVVLAGNAPRSDRSVELAAAGEEAEAAAGPAASPDPEPAPPPEWFVAHMAFMTQGSGRWITDNAPWLSEQEPWEAYGTEWKYGIGKASLTGRLFGLKDGKETGTFWEFRTWWHPGEKEVKAFQIGGGGAVALGTMLSTGPGISRATQTFFAPNGSSWSVGHDQTDSGTSHTTQSWNVAADGTWTKQRLYVWHLEQAPEKKAPAE